MIRRFLFLVAFLSCSVALPSEPLWAVSTPPVCTTGNCPLKPQGVLPPPPYSQGNGNPAPVFPDLALVRATPVTSSSSCGSASTAPVDVAVSTSVSACGSSTVVTGGPFSHGPIFRFNGGPGPVRAFAQRVTGRR